MSRWIAMHCTPEREELQRRHPNAWLLLCQIATRAKWKDCLITKLKAGEAFIGDWRGAGLPSEMAYRHAKKVLLDAGLAAFRGTNKGTVASLSSKTLFSVSSDPDNAQANSLATDEQQASNGPTTTNHKDTKYTKTHGEESPAALAEAIRIAYPRQTHLRDTLAEIEAAMRRHPAADILAGTRRIAAAVAGWTDAERLQFLKAPPEFFRSDHWQDDPEFWRSKQAARLETSGRKPLRTDEEIDRILGGRAHA